MTPGSARVKAHRLRAKLKNGEALKPSETEFLEAYNNGAHKAAAYRNEPAEDAVITEAPKPRPAPLPRQSYGAAPPPTATAPEGFVTLDFGVPSTGLAVTDDHGLGEANACTIKDCPKCKVTSGGKVCGTTGETVYDPIDSDSAYAMASTLMGLISVTARFTRKDKAFISATDKEREKLAKALQKTLNKRFNAAGAVDDIFALLFALGVYGHRAFNAPDPDAGTKALPPPPSVYRDDNTTPPPAGVTNAAG